MSDTPTPTPPKSEPAQPAKAPAKSTKPTTSKAAIAAPTIKASPINPAWATEVAKAYGLSGPLADAVAEKLVDAVSDAVSKVTKPEKLLKMVKEATNDCIGKV
jgi:hypothetical protein